MILIIDDTILVYIIGFLFWVVFSYHSIKSSYTKNGHKTHILKVIPISVFLLIHCITKKIVVILCKHL